MNFRDHFLHVTSFAILAFVVLLVSACSPATTPKPTDTIACTMDAFECPDGSFVGRTGPDCEFVCPDAPVGTPAEGSTFREYKSEDPEQCMVMRFTCDGSEFFGDETGCGCVREHNNAAVTLCTADYNPVCGWSGENIQCLVYPCAQTYGNLCMASVNPDVAYTTPGECPAPGSSPEGDLAPGQEFRKYVSRDQTQCAASMWICVEGYQQFYDDTGCGCEFVDTLEPPSMGMPVPGSDVEEKLVAFDCPAERPEACTREYMPVCGQREDGSSNTYGNDCTACANNNVVSYTEGACA